MNKKILRDFVNIFREEIQDDPLAYDEIMTLTEDGVDKRSIERLKEEYNIDLSKFGNVEQIKQLAIDFADNW